MNFTNSPYEKMMKEIPRPGRGGNDCCAFTLLQLSEGV